MRILLAGGTGFIGRHCRAALEEAGHAVICASRSSPAWSFDAGAPIPDRAGPPFDAIVNLVGIARERGRNTFTRAHVDAPRELVAWARRHGVRRFVHVSVVDVSAAPDNPAEAYRASKRAGEAVIRESGLAWTILRPGLVYGAGDDMMTNLVRLVRFAPVFPLSRRGGPLQLVDVRDVARGILAALEHDASIGRTIDLVGPERFTLAELTQRVADALGLPLARVALPPSWMRAAVHLPGAPLTATQLGMLEAGLSGESEPAAQLLGWTGRPLEDARIRELAAEVRPLAPSLRWLPSAAHREWLAPWRDAVHPVWTLLPVALLVLSPALVPALPVRAAVIHGLLAAAAVWALPLPWRTLWRPTWRAVAVGLGAGLLLLGATAGIVTWGSALVPSWWEDRHTIYAMEIGALPLAAIVAAEDLVWRGAVNFTLAARFGPARGALLGGLAFAVAHVTSGPALLVVAALGMGIVWNALALRTRSLFAVFACHLVWDLGMLAWRP